MNRSRIGSIGLVLVLLLSTIGAAGVGLGSVAADDDRHEVGSYAIGNVSETDDTVTVNISSVENETLDNEPLEVDLELVDDDGDSLSSETVILESNQTETVEFTDVDDDVDHVHVFLDDEDHADWIDSVDVDPEAGFFGGIGFAADDTLDVPVLGVVVLVLIAAGALLLRD